MRSGLQPIAIPCNEVPTTIGSRLPSMPERVPRNASAASNVLRRPILCKKTNVAELAFYEVHRLQISQVGTQGVHDRTPAGLGEPHALPICRTPQRPFWGGLTVDA
jgi:hypothetical protein